MSGCYGLEKCLSSFDLVDIQPGSKLHGLGLRKVDLSMSAVTRQRDELEQQLVRLALLFEQLVAQNLGCGGRGRLTGRHRHVAGDWETG